MLYTAMYNVKLNLFIAVNEWRSFFSDFESFALVASALASVVARGSIQVSDSENRKQVRFNEQIKNVAEYE